ncbi:VOC family protein [Pseudoflavonifractor sp. 524-17]|uniref:VOC family protein n=1 Tax=Pseudoflavonifractor sp. 524-17 TaxID=2304577 RepID=UPI00137A4CC5|nr:VOC family protein [Pseudoflavonifractor sp. 524-17]NCE64512.1 VOC family protein [Pseudoflavonifractor sp. 524-17]
MTERQRKNGIKGVHHICLKTGGEAAFEEAVRFYTQVLGFAQVRAWGAGENRSCMLDLGGCLLEIMANGAPAAEKGRFPHLALQVEDVDRMAALAKAAGQTVFVEPADKSLGPDYPIRIAFCKGPAGEDIEFFREY